MEKKENSEIEWKHDRGKLRFLYFICTENLLQKFFFSDRFDVFWHLKP